MKVKDTDIAKRDYASVTQVMDVAGERIGRSIGASTGMIDTPDEPKGVFATTQLFGNCISIWNEELGGYISVLQIPVAANRLNGKSTATVTAKGASLSGSWSVNLAKILTDDSASYSNIEPSFERHVHANNAEDYADFSATKLSMNSAKKFSFKESASENAKGVSAA